MRTVAEYLRFEADSRRLAVKLETLDDKRALELMATEWARLAAERKAQLEKEARKRL